MVDFFGGFSRWGFCIPAFALLSKGWGFYRNAWRDQAAQNDKKPSLW
jgi:hypothetical protein